MTVTDFKVLLVAVVLVVCPSMLVAKQMKVKQPVIKFLAEKVVFCYSRDSLALYKDRVDVFDIDGMNSIVLAGECDFVPDGKYLVLQEYGCHEINSTNVVSLVTHGVIVWTFASLVSKGGSEYAHITFDATSSINFTPGGLDEALCSTSADS